MLSKYLIAAAAIFASTHASSCVGESSDVGNQWRVLLDNDTKYNPNECGKGCLDNLRGRCGEIVDWGCSLDGSTGVYTFQTRGLTCTNYDVTQALLACTNNEEQIDCSGGNGGDPGEKFKVRRGPKGF